MERIYMNRRTGEQRIHVEITSSEVSDLLDDLQADPEHYDSTSGFLVILHGAEETFSPVVAEGRRDRAARTTSGQQPETTPTCTSTHPARPTRCILPGRHAVPHTDGACQWPEHTPCENCEHPRTLHGGDGCHGRWGHDEGCTCTWTGYTDASTAFMQVGRIPTLQGLRTELHIEGHPPIIGNYAGAGMRRLEEGVLAIEPLLLFAWTDTDNEDETR